MSENTPIDNRRRRVKRLKAILVTLFLIMLLTPTVLCIYALSQIERLNSRIDELNNALIDKVNQVELSQMLLEDSIVRDTGDEEEEAPHFEYYVDDYEVPEDFRKVYLTFDDGPSIYTTQILDILDTYGVKATFFVTGNKVAMGHPEWYQEIAGRGNTIGMHSFSHVYSDIYATPDNFMTDLNQISSYITETCGITPKYYRFPGGSSNTVSTVDMKMLCQYIEDEGMEYYDWDVSSGDATSPALRSSEIVNNVIQGVTKNPHSCIVLMHDCADKYSTVEALPAIIESILGMEKTVILPIDDRTIPSQHLIVREDMLEEE